jgi:hypothetical protein
MGILVVEFHGVALVDRVLLESFFQHGEEAVLCIYSDFAGNVFCVWQIRENIKNIALAQYALLSASKIRRILNNKVHY